MTKRSVMILLAGAVLLASALGCSLRQDLVKRLALEPTNTPAPTKTPRPTFTPTPNWTPTPTITPTPTNTPIPTDTPTPVPTDTPTPAPPTDTPTPAPTNTPRPPTATFTPAPPTATPTPSFAFAVKEQSANLPYRPTTQNGFIVIFVAITDAKNVPMGGYRVIGDSSTGLHAESIESCYGAWCVRSGESGTVKFGNVKFEPGPFIDGTWNIHIVDKSGTQVSPVVSFPYSTDKNQWVWDWVIFAKQ